MNSSESPSPVSGPNPNLLRKERAGSVFLLGAGFSRAISREMPLLQDIARHITERYRRPEDIPPEVRAIMEENLAHALSYLEQAKPWLTEAANLRHRALFLEFSSVIARDLEDIVRDITKDMARAVPDWLRRLIEYWHSERCTVLTLNYDTLIEAVAASQEPSHGECITARDVYPPMLTDAAMRYGATAPKKRLKTFRLLKLHGSTNWYYSGRTSAQGEPIYFVPPQAGGGVPETEDYEHRLRAVADKYPFLVPPVYDKSALFTHETIRALWFEAGEALKTAERVVCMGYSLPESDLTMKHFLRTTLRTGVAFDIVDPAKETIGNFSKLLQRANVKVNQTYVGEECIRRFVTDLPQARQKQGEGA